MFGDHDRMYKILSIDDDRVTHRFVRRALEPDYEIFEAADGDEGLKIANEQQPDIILLDVEMPGMNGYEVCDQFRHTPHFLSTPIVFLSAHSNLRERLQGYESGGNDYLTKPFEPETLQAKIRVLTESLEQQKALQKRAQEAQQTAYSAISTSSDLGQVVHFAELVATYTSLDSVGEAVLATSRNMSLSVVVSIRGLESEHWYSANTVSPLETQVMSLLKEEKRINDFGARTVVNYPFISLMVKNMPLDDMERYGRIKDIVPAILATANAKIEAIHSALQLKHQSVDITQTLEGAHEILSNLIRLGNGYRQQIDQNLKDMFVELQQKLPYMGLEEDQEQYIVQRIDQSIMAVRDIEEQSASVTGQVDTVISDLSELILRQKDLIERMAIKQQSSCDPDDKEDFQSVELF